MANTPVIAKANTGTGTDAFASDLISGTNWPYSKIAFGAESSATPVSSADPLPVDIGTPTIPVTGTFWQATQPVSGPLTDTQLRATPVPVSGTFWQATQPVSGPLTDAQLRATAVAVSAASLPLPTGAATQATLANIDTDIGLIESYFKAEDSPSASGDKGLLLLAMRQLADTTSTDADGDYTAFKIDEEGRVKVATKPASFALVTGNITANAQTVFCDVSRASNVQIHMVATSLVGHNVTFEGSLDSTNGTDGAWFGIQVIRSNANTIELTSGVLAATPAYAWEASVNGLSFIRVRATAHTSGTATWKFQRGSYATEPIPAAQISGTQPVSGTVTATVTGATVSSVLPTIVTDVASAALTTTTTTAAITPAVGQSYQVNIPVTAVSGTNPTLDVSIEESDDTGTNWRKVYDFPRITAQGVYRSPVLPLVGNRVRYVQTVGGTTPSFTRSVNRLQIQLPADPLRQLIDRTVAPNTLNSVTPSLDTRDGGNRVQIVVNMGAATTPPAFQIEGSEDNGVTWFSIGSPLTTVASSTVQLTVVDFHASLIRARVSTAGSGATLGWVLLKAHD